MEGKGKENERRKTRKR